MKSPLLKLLPLAIGTLALVLVITASLFGYRLSKETIARTAQLETTVSEHTRSLEQAKVELAALLAANETVANQLKEEAAKRVAAEAESIAAQKKLSALAQTIEEAQSQTASAIVKEWRPRIVAVRCTWTISGGTTTKLATAVLMPDPIQSVPQLFTSKHVVTNADKLPDSCELTFPDQDEEITVTKESITLSSTKYDWAKIALSNPPLFATLLSHASAARCTSAPATGDNVVILGYPKIGDKDDVTATEGIISGTDGKYYITSAKVERGNSGGAAVLTRQNCYLGIPTFVDAGEIESLARILEHQEIGSSD